MVDREAETPDDSWRVGRQIQGWQRALQIAGRTDERQPGEAHSPWPRACDRGDLPPRGLCEPNTNTSAADCVIFLKLVKERPLRSGDTLSFCRSASPLCPSIVSPQLRSICCAVLCNWAVSELTTSQSFLNIHSSVYSFIILNLPRKFLDQVEMFDFHCFHPWLLVMWCNSISKCFWGFIFIHFIRLSHFETQISILWHLEIFTLKHTVHFRMHNFRNIPCFKNAHSETTSSEVLCKSF
jgi:hypothetical protein